MASETAGTEQTQRDLHLQFIAERSRMAWQTASGYDRLALVELNVSRYKRSTRDAPRSRTDDRRAAEVAIAGGVLNVGGGAWTSGIRPHHVRNDNLKFLREDCVVHVIRATPMSAPTGTVKRRAVPWAMVSTPRAA